MSAKSTFLLCFRLPYERNNIEFDAQAYAAKYGIRGPYEVVQNRRKPVSIPVGSCIVFDNVARVADTVPELIKWLHDATARNLEILGPGPLDFRDQAPHVAHLRLVSKYLHQTRRTFRGVRIRTALEIRRQRGLTNGRTPISEDVKTLVIELNQQGKSIRAIATTLKSKGLCISKSAVFSILKGHLSSIQSTGGKQ